MKRRGNPSDGSQRGMGKKLAMVGLGSLVLTMGLPFSGILDRAVDNTAAQALQGSVASDPLADPANDPIADSGADPVAEPVLAPVADPVVEPVLDPMAEPVAEPTDRAPAATEEGEERDRPWLQELPSGPEFVPLTPRPQPMLRLRHGPYFPDLEGLEPPAPEPLWPTIVQPIRLVIRLSERRVYVYQGDDIQTSYPIAIGRSGWETPTGSYKVLDMQENPAWKNPFTGAIIPAGRNNPLGDRWIGFWSDGNNVIGFHGTPNEGSVGRAASHGCIRMFNRDVRALYAIAEVGMPVIVEP